VELFHLSVVDCGTFPLEYGSLWSVPLECGRLWSGPLECGRLWSVPLECGRLYSQKCSESNRFSLLVHLPKGRMNVTGRSLSLTISQFNVLLLEQVESNYTKMIIGKGAIHIYTSFGRSQKVSLAGRNYDNSNVNYTGLYESLFF
jgi:hypothetical protein